jgi:hypothetical protein
VDDRHPDSSKIPGFGDLIHVAQRDIATDTKHRLFKGIDCGICLIKASGVKQALSSLWYIYGRIEDQIPAFATFSLWPLNGQRKLRFPSV